MKTESTRVRKCRGVSRAGCWALWGACLVFLAGCAGQVSERDARDPLEPLNRVSFEVTERLDQYFMRPLARAYEWALPDFAVTGIYNFFHNLRTLDSAVNGLLQGRPRSAATDAGRFLANSTFGLGGLFDVATGMGLVYQDRDLGQTLAVWGYTDSSYVYVPFLGPSTIRDLPGTFLKAAWVPLLLKQSEGNFWVEGVDVVSVRAERLRATDARDAMALESYSFTREAYYQQRRFKLFEGEPPAESGFEALDWLEEEDSGEGIDPVEEGADEHDDAP